VTALDNFLTSRKLAREQVQVLLIGFTPPSATAADQPAAWAVRTGAVRAFE
jgi:hypothetical protein